MNTYRTTSYNPTTGTSPCWGIDETLRGNTPQEALSDWMHYHHEYLQEKAEELGCEIEELGRVEAI